MPRLCRHLIAVLCLSVSVVGFASADEPEPGMVRLLRTLEDPTGRVGGLTFSADGRTLLTSGTKTVRLWDTATGKQLATFDMDGGGTLSPDGRVVAAQKLTRDDYEVVLIDAASGRVLQRLPHPKSVYWFAFTPDSKTLVSTCEDINARLWDVATGEEVRRIHFRPPGGGDWVWKKGGAVNGFPGWASLSPDGKTLAVGLDDGTVPLYDLATGVETARLRRPDDRIEYLVFAPDGKLATVEPMRRRVHLWDVSTAKPACKMQLDKMEMRWLAVSPDDKSLALCCEKEGQVRLLEAATGRLRRQFAVKGLFTLAFSPKGSVLATADMSGDVQLWDWRDPCLSAAAIGPKEVERAWADLAAEDAEVGYRAIAVLVGAPEQSVGMLGSRLAPAESASAEQFDRLVARLDHEDFAEREEASRRLAVFGAAARGALERALTKAPSAEQKHRCEELLAKMDGPPAPETLRSLRAVEALESIGTAEARRIVQKLAEGAPGAMETVDARAALKRLDAK